MKSPSVYHFFSLHYSENLVLSFYHIFKVSLHKVSLCKPIQQSYTRFVPGAQKFSFLSVGETLFTPAQKEDVQVVRTIQ